jgi:hypothetical protein
LPATQKVQVKVIHRLPSRNIAVEQQPITRLRNPKVGRDFSRSEDQRRKYSRVGICYVVHGGHVLFWNNEHVRRRLRIDVVERKDFGILENDIARQLSRNDLAEETVRLHWLSLKELEAL